MKILQLLPTISFGDAVSNDTIVMKNAIIKMGFTSKIYAENIDDRLPKGTALSIRKIPRLSSNDIIIYHLSTGTNLNYNISHLNGRKIIIYHNVTPSYFFRGYSIESELRSIEGLKGARYLSTVAEYALADSEYNRQKLIRMGYKCPIDVLPILLDFDDYKKVPNKKILQKYDDKWVNIIFTGRIVPNKKQEDIISSFFYYKKYMNPKSRLFLVGSANGMEVYEKQLKLYVEQLHLEDVHFTGHVGFDDILAYYKIADVFLCMSEHEGFCVPLVEAMLFDIPIIAYDSTAIRGTLNGSGFLLKEKNFQEIAGVINKVVSDCQLNEAILTNQRIRLNDFKQEIILKQFENFLKRFINRYEK